MPQEMICYLDFSVSTTGMLAEVKVLYNVGVMVGGGDGR